MTDFRMPSLGADIETGTLVQWLVKPGDKVKRGDIIAVVETEKGAIEIEIFLNGVVRSIEVPEGEKVPVGTVLAQIGTDGEAAPAKPAPPPARPAAAASAATTRPQPVRPTPRPAPPMPKRAQPSHRPRVSPLARRVAAELGIELAGIKGTGPGGAITKADIERAAAGAVAPARPAASRPAIRPGPQPGTAAMPAEKQAAMRRAIGAAMARSKREIPHYYLGTQIDMSRALMWLREENLKRPVTDRLLYSVILLKAVALALHEVPELNGFWIDGAYRPGDGIQIGVAISLRQGGLIAPAIHDIDRMSLSEIMTSLRDLVKRVRAGSLRSSEIADATITVTSLGEQGVETVFGVIYPPQVALVGFGKIVERPWAQNGMLGARPVIMASLSADHRASDGHRGGLFLSAVGRLLQEPEKL